MNPAIDSARHRPHSLDVLLACLDRLRHHNEDWTQLAEAHYSDMLSGRFDAMESGVAALEQELLAIAEEEDLRIQTTLDLGFELGLPDDPPPRLSELAALLPAAWGQELTQQGQNLRAALVLAEDAAKRSTGLAAIGLQVSQGVIRLAQEAAVRSTRPPAAYVRGGRRTTGTAIPVFHRSWKA